MIQPRAEFGLIGRLVGLRTYPPTPLQPPGSAAKAKELAARAKALIAHYKSLFAVNVKPLQGVCAITTGGPGGSDATAAPSSALVFLDSLEDVAAGPPVTNAPSP